MGSCLNQKRKPASMNNNNIIYPIKPNKIKEINKQSDSKNKENIINIDLNLNENFSMTNPTKITKRSFNKKIPLIHYEGNNEDNKLLIVSQKLKKKKKTDINSYNMDNIKMLELLGKGGFGEVFRAYDKITGKLLAIKYFKEPDFSSIRDEDYLMTIVEGINEKNQFIKYYGLFKDSSDQGQPDKYIIIMESGDINLKEILQIRKKYEISQILYIFQSLINDFLYLQLNGICTRDVKTENIILIQDEKDTNLYNYKISDFGIGCIVEKEKLEINNNDLAGCTLMYSAPEIKLISEKIENKNDEDDDNEIILVNDKQTYDPFKADVYSLGITILDLMGLNKNEFINNKINDNSKIFDLIGKMLKDNPQERISFIEIKNDLTEIILKSECKQPIDELIYIKKFKEYKNKGKDNKIKINEYLSLFENYFNIGVYKIANDFLSICFNDIYLKNKNDLSLKNSEIEGKMFFQLGRFAHLIKQDSSKAEEYYLKSLSIREKVLGLNHQDTAKSYNNLANFYSDIKHNYIKAEEYYMKSLAIREKVLGLNHNDTADSYQCLANFYCGIKEDYMKAEEYYIKSISIYESVGLNNQNLAMSYNNLAMFYSDIKHDYVKAEKYYMKSLNIREKLLGINHQETADSYNNLADFYSKIKIDYDRAEEYYIKALTIREKLLSSNHQETAASYNDLAIFYHNIKQDYIKAEEYYLKSLIIREKVLGLNHHDTADSYHKSAIFYLNIKKDFVKAEEYYTKSLTIYEKTLGKNHKNTILLYDSLYQFYENNKKDHEKALIFKRI